MIAQVAARKALADETVESVVERTSGVPLFVEELTLAVLEARDARLSGGEIPATLHDSLLARLDRLGQAKEVAQIGAVIGGEFKHGLIRDAAYEALLKSRRRELHSLAAQTINERFPSLREAHPEMLARHWMEAEQPEPASLEWARAGNRAESRAALSEAQEFYEPALSLVSRLPESPDRNLRELELRQALVRVLQIRKGYSDWETVAANGQVAMLAEKSGNPVQLITQIIASCNAAIASGDFGTAEALADQALEPAAREGSSATLGLAHGLQVITHYWPGHFAKVEKHLAEGIAAFEDPAFAQFPGVAIGALGFAAWNAWTIGRADLARQRVARMMAISDVNNAFDAAFSHVQAANLQIFIRNYEQAQTLAARSLELSRDQFPMQAAMSLCLLGVARAQLGQGTEGVELAQQGVALWHQIGMGVGTSWMRGYLATAQECTGSLIEALNTVEQALASAPAELAYLPEALRLLGELHLKLEQREEAERDFRHSVYRARETGAKAWELRSTMNVARLLVSQGRCNEARSTLAEIYNWFTEGFDTADLKDAKALLDELSR
jgi:tetratricopeptide (TPR) repeat protein